MRLRLSICFCISFLLCFAAGLHAQAQVRRDALPPLESVRQVELAEGYVAKLLASEPHVIDPVEVTFDDSGRLWVVEMRDYPFQTGSTPQGRIRVLSDLDGDGRYEHSTTFADQLNMPTGLAVWRSGAVVTLAGKLVFLRDDDGDLQADETQVWLEGLAEDNEQLRANHPQLGLDGKWTIASGLRGGDVRPGKDFTSELDPVQPVAVGSRDLRFDPVSGTIELVTGPAQFGLCVDGLGNRFFCSNRNPAVQVVFEQEDLVGNALAGILPSVRDVIPAGETSQVYPLVNAWTTSNLHAGQFTAACGVLARTGEVFDRQGDLRLANEVFCCEPTGCLVKRCEANISNHAAQSLDSSANDGREWLASRDAWFRPVNLSHAPDGSLVVVDMHRAVIEHPQWVPEELKKRTDERWGDHSGRILWVGTPEAESQWAHAMRELRNNPLAGRTTIELAELVTRSESWMRATATRLIIERGELQISDELYRFANDASRPLIGRVSALMLAVHLAAPSEGTLQELSSWLDSDAPPELSIALLRALRASGRLQLAHIPTLNRAVQVDNPDLQFEAFLCLGRLAEEHVISRWHAEELVRSAVAADNGYLLVAAAAALRTEPQWLITAWLDCLRGNAPAETDASSRKLVQTSISPTGVARALAKELLGRKGEPVNVLGEVVLVAEPGLQTQVSLAAMTMLAEVAARRHSLAVKLLDDDFWEALAGAVGNRKLTSANWLAEVELLSYSPRASDRQLIADLARHENELEARRGLLRAWAITKDPSLDAYLVDSIPGSSPPIRATLLQLIGQSPARLEGLIRAIDAGRVSSKQIGASELKGLVTRSSGETQAALQRALDEMVDANRAAVVQEYEVCLSLDSDPVRGKQIFRSHCASCHRIGDVGYQVGPDISDSRTQQPLQLLASILNPNLVIDNNYFRYVVLTRDDVILEGIVVEETRGTVVLRGQENQRSVLNRQDIVEMKATGTSLMPEGIEAQIDQQSMADLIAYIKGWRYLDGPMSGLSIIKNADP